MQTDKSYQKYHLKLITAFNHKVIASPPFNSNELTDDQEKLVNILNQFLSASEASNQMIEDGRWVITTIVSTYQHLMPHLPRDLFWYFGGDCLHYLEDDEIQRFQQLDEIYHESLAQNGESINYEQLVLGYEQPPIRLQ